MTTFDGKVALVTGSSRGIGEAIALEFARQGAAVVVHGRDPDALARVEAAIHAAGGRAISVTADLTNFGQIEAMRAQIEERLGPVDILVANAGGNLTPPALLEDIPEEGWRATIDSNLLATSLTLKCFSAPHERASQRQHHHHFVGCRATSKRAVAHCVQCGEGGHSAHDTGCCCAGGAGWNQSKLHRT